MLFVLSDLYLRFRRHAWTQKVIFVLVRIEHDAHRNALHDLHVISRRIFWGKEAEARAASASDSEHLTLVLPASGIDFDINGLPRFHIAKLGLFEIRSDPNIRNIHQRQERLSRLDILANFGGAMPN